ncbi:MAG: hypothetical protein GY828_03665, partial [Candidatus Gracilibacteria bacterium]|nr:hypothetical protein [Candidatus Gracilibacteria bacterium]
CTKCIKPNTSHHLVDIYSQEATYFDVYKNTKYYYCIADSKTKGHIKGYPSGAACQNGDQKENEVAFCPYNPIILEEALAIVMRRGNILSHDEALYFLSQMDQGQPYPDLSDDVKPKTKEGSHYSFYPYFYTAQDYLLSEYNTQGEKQVYKLVEKKNNLYNPKKRITREDFLKMAVFAMKNSNCIDFKNDYISGDIQIIGGKCAPGDTSCKEKADYIPSAKMDISSDLGTKCILGMNEEDGYHWIFYHFGTSTEELYTGKYIDNHSFKHTGDYKLSLRATDNCDNEGEITKYITIQDDYAKAFSATIGKKIQDGGKVDFHVISQGGESPFQYDWDFGDSQRGT